MRGYLLGQTVTHIHTCAHIYAYEMLLPGCKKEREQITPLSSLTTEGRRRLQAIENFSDLGSGIHIAMQDLDIRGAGNLLGAEQSGFVADLASTRTSK